MENYEIKRATLDEKETLSNLLQFYIYDFSEFMDLQIEDNGKFGEYPLNEYWTDCYRFPYLILLNEKIAGFVLVKLINRDEDDSYFSIAEFFIMKRFRRSGLGKQVAKDIFNMHKGPWEVYQIDSNEPAQHFWKKTIEEYTGGKFTERIEIGRKTQVFVS
ncbi:GNAT family N-acetyltransferase [Brevibacillus sp. AG]|uniref:GNAT family N-acetyltransferase n=1 Tax=Brevibacillus sp. AG TaxID=3020891 RepID=UPI002331410B|nr:GNAT family N-acetyltransferase [Brevibacillus sp. AG]MDC0764176.1 GNAT family N-acetyltransferase [Brevibacillus sp. AG]